MKNELEKGLESESNEGDKIQECRALFDNLLGDINEVLNKEGNKERKGILKVLTEIVEEEKKETLEGIEDIDKTILIEKIEETREEYGIQCSQEYIREGDIITYEIENEDTYCDTQSGKDEGTLGNAA